MQVADAPVTAAMQGATRACGGVRACAGQAAVMHAGLRWPRARRRHRFTCRRAPRQVHVDASACKTLQLAVLVACLREAGLLPRLTALRFACQRLAGPVRRRAAAFWSPPSWSSVCSRLPHPALAATLAGGGRAARLHGCAVLHTRTARMRMRVPRQLGAARELLTQLGASLRRPRLLPLTARARAGGGAGRARACGGAPAAAGGRGRGRRGRAAGRRARAARPGRAGAGRRAAVRPGRRNGAPPAPDIGMGLGVDRAAAPRAPCTGSGSGARRVGAWCL